MLLAGVCVLSRTGRGRYVRCVYGDPADMFWGDRHGQLEDPFGHRWNIAQHLRDVPHDEVAAAQAFT